jgi:hypothetical protein
LEGNVLTDFNQTERVFQRPDVRSTRVQGIRDHGGREGRAGLKVAFKSDGTPARAKTKEYPDLHLQVFVKS